MPAAAAAKSFPKAASRTYVAKAARAGTEGSDSLQWMHSGKRDQYDVPVPPATLTIRDIHSKIPQKYFQRVMLKSFMYVARDLLQSAVTFYVMYSFGAPGLERAEALLTNVLPVSLAIVATLLMKLVAWNVFWYVQGLNWTGLWVMAHECGHQAFSDSRSVNDAVGIVLHSFLLVPYHSWRISHGNHHKHTNHLTKDTVFVPRKEVRIIDSAEDAPIVSLAQMLFTFTLGWPGYLIGNVAAQDYGRRTNHFEPSSPLFRREDRNDIVVSNVGILAMLSLIGLSIYKFGAANVACYYLMPYLWVNFWLVFITYLQHTDIRLPHYDPSEWNFVRGAFAAVDRDFGFLLNWWFHHINDSHVVHHTFSQMPFYHAIEVTRRHLREIAGDMYLTDNRPILKSLWESWRECRYVVPTEGVCVYRK